MLNAAYLAHITSAEPALRDPTVELQVGQDRYQQMRLGNVADQPGAFAYQQVKHLDDPSAISAPEYLCPDSAESCRRVPPSPSRRQEVPLR